MNRCVKTFAPEVKSVQQPVQLLGAQHDGLVGSIERCFEPFALQVLEPKTEAVELPIQDFDPVAMVIQKDEKYRVEHGNFDIQLD